MATHDTTLTGVKLSELNIEEKGYLADALKGYWVRKWDGVAKLTVVRGHCMFSTPVVSEPTIIKFKLPTHPPFYLNILSTDSSRTKLVTGDIEIVLTVGEQIQAVFTLEV